MKVVELHCYKDKNIWNLDCKIREAKTVFIRKNGKMFFDTKDEEGYVLLNFLYTGIGSEPHYTIIISDTSITEYYKNKFLNYCKKEERNGFWNFR